MTRFPILFVSAATAMVALASVAEARDGCGRGWFHNGVACVQAEGRYYDDGPRYYRPAPPTYYGNTVRPTMGANGQISCNNPNYTWQNGACKPYRGP